MIEPGRKWMLNARQNLSLVVQRNSNSRQSGTAVDEVLSAADEGLWVRLPI
jgi:hypothetical protein